MIHTPRHPPRGCASRARRSRTRNAGRRPCRSRRRRSAGSRGSRRARATVRRSRSRPRGAPRASCGRRVRCRSRTSRAAWCRRRRTRRARPRPGPAARPASRSGRAGRPRHHVPVGKPVTRVCTPAPAAVQVTPAAMAASAPSRMAPGPAPEDDRLRRDPRRRHRDRLAVHARLDEHERAHLRAVGRFLDREQRQRHRARVVVVAVRRDVEGGQRRLGERFGPRDQELRLRRRSGHAVGIAQGGEQVVRAAGRTGCPRTVSRRCERMARPVGAGDSSATVALLLVSPFTTATTPPVCRFPYASDARDEADAAAGARHAHGRSLTRPMLTPVAGRASGSGFPRRTTARARPRTGQPEDGLLAHLAVAVRPRDADEVRDALGRRHLAEREHRLPVEAPAPEPRDVWEARSRPVLPGVSIITSREVAVRETVSIEEGRAVRARRPRATRMAGPTSSAQSSEKARNPPPARRAAGWWRCPSTRQARPGRP